MALLTRETCSMMGAGHTSLTSIMRGQVSAPQNTTIQILRAGLASPRITHRTRTKFGWSTSMSLNRSESPRTLEFLLVSNFNSGNLAALLSKDREAPRIRARAAPFGQVMQVLL